MYLWIVRVLYLLHIVVFAQPSNGPTVNFASPPNNKFCFFTSGGYVFEERLKEVAPSAEMKGAAKLESVYAHINSTDVAEFKNVWGAAYFLSNDDLAKVVEAARQQMMIADVTVVLNENETMECVTMTVGLLPSAFPFSIYTPIPKEVRVTEYLSRLKQIGVPQDYVSWLETLPAINSEGPPTSYIAPPGFQPPTIKPPPRFKLGHGPVIQPYQIPSDKLCVFAAGELVFQDAMTAVAPSATLIAAGYLWDEHVALGGHAEPFKFPKYKGFDRVWGVAYTINDTDLTNFTGSNQQSIFLTDVTTIVNQLFKATCKTRDIGLLPAGFPFQVFKESQLDVKAYLKRLTDVGVPPGYIQRIESIGNIEALKKLPTTGQKEVNKPTVDDPAPNQ